MSHTLTSSATPAESPVTALTGATAAVYTELCGQDGVSAAALALAADVSPSATRKALVTLEQQGLARRTPGGNDRTRRLPDLWYPTTPGDTPSDGDEMIASALSDMNGDCETGLPSDGEDTGGSVPQMEPEGESVDALSSAIAPDGPDAAEGAGNGELDLDPRGVDDEQISSGVPGAEAGQSELLSDPDATVSDGPQQSRDREGPADSQGNDDGTGQQELVDEEIDTSKTFTTEDATESVALTDHSIALSDDPEQDQVPGVATAPEGGESGSSAPGAGASQLGSAGEWEVDRADGDDLPAQAEHVCVCSSCGSQMRSRRRKRPATAPGGGPRLAPGQLHQMVLDHLRANPEQDWTPTKISQALGRSSGAIANALDTMAGRGEAVMTSTKPRRYKAVLTTTEELPGEE